MKKIGENLEREKSEKIVGIQFCGGKREATCQIAAQVRMPVYNGLQIAPYY